MKEKLEEAKKELVRVDHLIYVSLKYSRTVDVIKNCIDRLISTIEIAMECLLKYSKEKKLIKEIPASPVEKANLLKQIFDTDSMITEVMDLFLSLRKISRAKFTRAREFRRHVTMTVVIDDKPMELKIDTMHEDYDLVKDFIEYVSELIQK